MSASLTNFTINQLIASYIPIGYNCSSWDPRINYFLIGAVDRINYFNIALVYSTLKKMSYLFTDFLIKKGHVWLHHENFKEFRSIKDLRILVKTYPELGFFYKRWVHGALSNFKGVKMISKRLKFPHAVFFPNFSRSFFTIAECIITSVPSFVLVDSFESPNHILYPIASNSRHIRALFFYYIYISKVALYSRYKSGSTFLFSCFRKSKAASLNTWPTIGNLAFRSKLYISILKSLNRFNTLSDYTLNEISFLLGPNSFKFLKSLNHQKIKKVFSNINSIKKVQKDLKLKKWFRTKRKKFYNCWEYWEREKSFPFTLEKNNLNLLLTRLILSFATLPIKKYLAKDRMFKTLNSFKHLNQFKKSFK